MLNIEQNVKMKKVDKNKMLIKVVLWRKIVIESDAFLCSNSFIGAP
jgi:hypothetical protein